MDKRELSQTPQAIAAFTLPAHIRLLEANANRPNRDPNSPPARKAQERADDERKQLQEAVEWMAEQGYEVTPGPYSYWAACDRVPLNKMRKIKVRKTAPTVEATPAPEPAPALIASLVEQDEAEQEAIYAEHERLHEQGDCPPDCWPCQDEAMMQEDGEANDPDAFRVTPPSMMDAWEDNSALARPCSCGAFEEGYRDHGPAHDKGCRMYSEAERDFEQRARERVRPSRVWTRAAIASMADYYEENGENGDYFRQHSPW